MDKQQKRQQLAIGITWGISSATVTILFSLSILAIFLWNINYSTHSEAHQAWTVIIFSGFFAILYWFTLSILLHGTIMKNKEVKKK